MFYREIIKIRYILSLILWLDGIIEFFFLVMEWVYFVCGGKEYLWLRGWIMVDYIVLGLRIFGVFFWGVIIYFCLLILGFVIWFFLVNKMWEVI